MSRTDRGVQDDYKSTCTLVFFVCSFHILRFGFKAGVYFYLVTSCVGFYFLFIKTVKGMPKNSCPCGKIPVTHDNNAVKVIRKRLTQFVHHFDVNFYRNIKLAHVKVVTL